MDCGCAWKRTEITVRISIGSDSNKVRFSTSQLICHYVGLRDDDEFFLLLLRTVFGLEGRQSWCARWDPSNRMECQIGVVSRTIKWKLSWLGWKAMTPAVKKAMLVENCSVIQIAKVRPGTDSHSDPLPGKESAQYFHGG